MLASHGAGTGPVGARASGSASPGLPAISARAPPHGRRRPPASLRPARAWTGSSCSRASSIPRPSTRRPRDDPAALRLGRAARGAARRARPRGRASSRWLRSSSAARAVPPGDGARGAHRARRARAWTQVVVLSLRLPRIAGRRCSPAARSRWRARASRPSRAIRSPSPRCSASRAAPRSAWCVAQVFGLGQRARGGARAHRLRLRGRAASRAWPST